MDSVHFPLWRYNPDAEGKKLTLDSTDKSDTVSFAYPPLVGGSRSARTHPKRKRGRANAVSKELGENRAALVGGFAVASQPSLRSKASSAHLKLLVKKIGQDKARSMPCEAVEKRAWQS